MSQPDVVTLPLRCPTCGRLATLGCSVWTPEAPREAQTWRCPHCHVETKADLPGKVAWVLARQDPDATPTKR